MEYRNYKQRLYAYCALAIILTPSSSAYDTPSTSPVPGLGDFEACRVIESRQSAWEKHFIDACDVTFGTNRKVEFVKLSDAWVCDENSDETCEGYMVSGSKAVGECTTLDLLIDGRHASTPEHSVCGLGEVQSVIFHQWGNKAYVELIADEHILIRLEQDGCGFDSVESYLAVEAVRWYPPMLGDVRTEVKYVNGGCF